MSEFFRLRVRLWGMLTAAGFLAACGTIAGFLGRYAWWLDLGSHFRIQYTIFFLLLALLYAAGRQRRWAVAALLMAVVNGAPVAAFLLPRAPAVAPAGASRRAMLVNVNTHRGNPDAVMKAVRAEDPDILLLEETSDGWVIALKPLLETYPVRKIVTRDDNFGIGLLSRLPCVSTQVCYLGTALVPSVIAEMELDGRTITVMVTHPPPPAGAEYSAFRNEQLRDVAGTIVALRGPVLLMGDLNVTPWSYHYRNFLKTSGLKDSARGRTVRPTWPTFAPALGVAIDHCFHSEDVVIASRRVGRTVGSDHYPLIVDFGLQAPRGED